MSTAWSPIRSSVRETSTMRSTHSRRPGSATISTTLSTKRRFERSISSSRSTSDADHLLCPFPHVLEALEQHGIRLDVRDELRQLRDRDAVVGHSLEVQVDVQDREDEPQIGRDRGLPREQRLDLLLDLEVEAVHVVVERDHLVGQLEVALREGVERTAERPQDERTLLLQARLELVELGL